MVVVSDVFDLPNKLRGFVLESQTQIPHGESVRNDGL